MSVSVQQREEGVPNIQRYTFVAYKGLCVYHLPYIL